MNPPSQPAYMLHTGEHGLVEITAPQAEKLKQSGDYQFADTVLGSTARGVVFITSLTPPPTRPA